MKKFYDDHRTERSFNVRYLVYLKFQPYHQVSKVLQKNLKLCPRYYGPFEVIKRIGAMAYKLKLPKNSKLYLVFHVFMLKKR